MDETGKMAETLELCLAQMTSTDAHAGNIDTARTFVAAAADHGAALICFPEAANMMQRDRAKAAEIIQPERSDPFLAACRDLALKHGIWIHTGSLALREDGAIEQHHPILRVAGRESAVVGVDERSSAESDQTNAESEDRGAQNL